VQFQCRFRLARAQLATKFTLVSPISNGIGRDSTCVLVVDFSRSLGLGFEARRMGFGASDEFVDADVALPAGRGRQPGCLQHLWVCPWYSF
jgi:hypothetical protein